jgi:8-oxo-dGTP pyrophosphatase MutT (NUDIX family)
MKQYIHLIEKGMQELPGVNGQMKMAPIHREKDYRNVSEDFRSSAVALVLYPSEKKINSLLIQRPIYKGAHSGQIALPGGKLEKDENTLEAAIRETKEEIDLDLTTENHLGVLTDLYIPVSNFIVTPHVFYIEELPPLTKEEREVAAILTFPIELLNHPDTRLVKDIPVGQFTLKDVPYFSIEQKTVWGATAIILSEFSEILKGIDQSYPY